MRIRNNLAGYIIGLYVVGVYGISNPRLHYMESAWAPERVMLQEGLSEPRRLGDEEVLFQSCDVNSDGISDFFFSSIYNVNGRAGYIWTPYLSISDHKYQKVKGVCFHAFNQGTAFCSDDGSIYSSWSGGAAGGSVVKISRTPTGWNEEQYATYKRTEDLRTVVETKDGRSIVVGVSDHLMNEIRDNLIPAPSQNDTILFFSDLDYPLKSNVSVNASVSKEVQETRPAQAKESGNCKTLSASIGIKSEKRIWMGAGLALMVLLGLWWFMRRKR